MVSLVAPFVFPGMSLGCLALQYLEKPQYGTVKAVFDSTFYIQFGPQMLCIGTNEMSPGPLNLVTSAPRGTNWHASGLRLNDKVTISEADIRVSNLFIFPLSKTKTWSPKRIPGMLFPEKINRGLSIFRSTAIRRLPREGLGSFLIPQYEPNPNNQICYSASPAIDEAQKWIMGNTLENRTEAHRSELNWVHQLLGLGTGLTPSGDDFLGGLMIALNAVLEQKLCSRLWGEISLYEEITRNAISYAHLSAAAHGFGADAIHRALVAIVCDDRIALEGTFPDIEKIGHSSGWDIMTGIAVTINSWLAAGRLNHYA